MTGLLLFLQHVGLAFRLHAATPLDAFDAVAHVHAAMAAATDDVPAELLLGMAYVESRFDPFAVSRIEGQKRVHGRYPSTVPPKRLSKRGTLYCGVVQTFAKSWETCLAQRDLHIAYSTAAMELGVWLRDRRVRGDMKRALSGYGCGNHGVTTGKCNRYPGRVLYQARRFAVTMGARPPAPPARTRRAIPAS